ncbi:hypothetical protein V2J09_021650 [Rumex salicifolius]
MPEWTNQPAILPLNQFGDSGYTGGINDSAATPGIGDALFVKVMTDEQLEVLRTQIAAYSSITEQLIEMHKSATSQQDLGGVRLGHFYTDHMVTSAGHKITARQRWTPAPLQLQFLEGIFDQGIGTPSKQKIREIVAELSQYGQISETNVYNWFQNRRARCKRKQINSASNTAGSEADAEAESPKEKTTKPEKQDTAAAENYCYQGQEMSSEIHSIDPVSNKVETVFPSDECVSVKPSENLGHLSFYESMMDQSKCDNLTTIKAIKNI